MQTKFESKSNRVKGLCFHPHRPWILSSLHNGAVQLFDYRNKCLLHSFEEHDGPVRGVDFHTSQPLFVSGGDDYKIKVWNYKLKRCLFTLLGHLDYVRTVKFHQEQPWILSASDDQTIRIWNWQSRTCITTLTGHNHYVMSAFFHPQDPLIVSASLDNSVRVWDISPLMKSSPSMSNDIDLPKLNSDLFGSNEVSVKFTLEGHERGVNWANFHPNLPLIVSGADDRQIKIWRMNETNAWEVDTLKGHVNNVSSVAFHPNKDLIISNAEDRSIKVWDTSRRVCIQTYKRENDRFWVLATHPTKNIIAAGHDSGMMVFSLDRERPANVSTQRETFFIKEQRYLRCYQYAKASEDLVLTLPKVDKSYKSPKYLLRNSFSAPNESKGTFLVFYDKPDNGLFQLVTPKSEDVFEGNGLDVIFISRNRFAVLEKSSRISIRNFSNEVTKRIQPNISQIENIYGTPINGRILLKSADKLHLYDIQARKMMAEYYIQNVKKVYYDKYITVISKNSLTILDKNLAKLVSIQEPAKIKSVLWNASSTVLYYTTLCQIKYLILSSQDQGILKSISDTVYLTKIVEKSDYQANVFGITKDTKFLSMSLNISEISFKLSLERKKFGKVMQIIKNNKLEGKSIINYLYQKSLPSVALHFVDDLKMKFKLAISCSNLKIAMETCLAINEEEYFETLAKEALVHGNVTIVEMCYQKIRSFDKLNFLYLVTGEKEKLDKMYKIAENRNDVIQQFNLSLVLNKVKERISILEKCGQYSLAYVTAARNNLKEESERIEKRMVELNMKIPNIEAINQWSQNQPMTPAKCIVPEGSIENRNWPLKEVNRGVVYDALMKGIDLMDDTELVDNKSQHSEEEEYFEAEEEKENPLFSDDDAEFDAQDDELEEDLAGDGWNNDKEDDDLDFGAELQSPVEKSESFLSSKKEDTSNSFEMPKKGIDIQAVWQQSSSLAVDHIAAGNFQSAKELLRRQIGIENFQPLLPKMRQIYLGATMSLTALPNVSNMAEPLIRGIDHIDLSNDDQRLKAFAAAPFNLELLETKLKAGKNLFQAGKFQESVQEFRDILYCVPFTVVNKAQSSEISSLISTVKEYLLGLLIELKRRETTDPKRALELAVYFSNCKLEPKHMILVLNTAMKAAYKVKNYITAVHLAQKLLALNEFNQDSYAEKRKIAQKVLKKSEMNATNAIDIDFKKDEEFSVCVVSLTPIYSGEKFVKCPFTKVHAKPEYKGQISPLCGISVLGKETLGLLCSD